MQDNDNTIKRAPKPRMPSDFDSEEDFLSCARKLYYDDVGGDRINRDEGRLDAEFVAGKQWDEAVYQRRIRNKLPALTVNRLLAFVSQVIGNRRLNDTQIKIIPDHDGDKEVARVREGLIRNIQKNSRAKRAFDTAFQNQVITGLGNFQVVLDYVSDDVFDQEIRIEAVHDDTAVAWDYNSDDPTGADAKHVFVTERITKEEFRKRYPDFPLSNFQSDLTDYSRIYGDGWIDQDTVRIADFWRVRSRKRTRALLTDGRSIDITELTDEQFAEIAPAIQIDPRNGNPIVREIDVKYAEMYRMSGANVLEGPYELPIKRVPVFRCPGWEINTGTYKTRFGLIRFLRDPQRLHNYWRSVIAEKLMRTPRQKWLVGKTAAQGYEKNFRNSHLSTDSVLFYNDEATAKPEIVQPAQMEPALVQEAAIASQDIKDISNLHEASLGQTSNEVSGKAIMARQRVGETGTVIYQDNLNMAMEEAGYVINDLIPFVYDTPRVVKVLGRDEDVNPEFVRINYTGDPNSVDITSGKYNVTIVTGPSYATKRIEAQESMQAAFNANPQAYGVAADLFAESWDWPGADKIAERIRRTMPPDILGEETTPEQQAQLQEQAQLAQEAQDIAKAKELADIALTEAKTEETQAKVYEIMATLGHKMEELTLKIDDLQMRAVKTAADIQSQETRDNLQTIDALTGENNVSG